MPFNYVLKIEPSAEEEDTNVVVNGGFDDSSAWALGDGWSISGGKAHSASSENGLAQVGILTADTNYLVTFTCVITSGGVHLSGSAENERTTSGTYAEVVSNTSSLQVAFYSDTPGVFTIDDVSAVPV
jgi:hypothetical protein